MSYVDGFVVPVPEGEIENYRQLSQNAGKVWLEYGALDFKECVIDDDNIEGLRSFADTAGVREGETVVFAFIVFESREHRDEVNKKVLADPRIKCEQGPEKMPFDCARMAYGGFKTIVEY